ALEGKLAETYATLEGKLAETYASLEGKLAETYDRTAATWTERLAEHQKSVEEGVAQTGALVREAAEGLKASGVDLSSLAELFSSAVDRYKEASERWLTGLAAMRAAAERAAQGD